MTAKFHDKVVLITGAGTGIGRAIALTFARENATVVVAGRTSGTLAQTVKEIEGDGGVADAITADVSEGDQVEQLVGEVVDRHGGLHIAVNNAGIIGTPGPIADLDEGTWSKVVATNLTGVWLSMKHEIAHMRISGGGTIVNMASSLGAHLALPYMGAYAATKAAVSTLTRTAAKEYISDGIRINAISPGPVDTPMSLFPGETDADRDARLAEALPIGRVAATEEIATAALWLASDESSYVVGHDLVIDGAGTP